MNSWPLRSPSWVHDNVVHISSRMLDPVWNIGNPGLIAPENDMKEKSAALLLANHTYLLAQGHDPSPLEVFAMRVAS